MHFFGRLPIMLFVFGFAWQASALDCYKTVGDAKTKIASEGQVLKYIVHSVNKVDDEPIGPKVTKAWRKYQFEHGEDPVSDILDEGWNLQDIDRGIKNVLQYIDSHIDPFDRIIIAFQVMERSRRISSELDPTCLKWRGRVNNDIIK